MLGYMTNVLNIPPYLSPVVDVKKGESGGSKSRIEASSCKNDAKETSLSKKKDGDGDDDASGHTLKGKQVSTIQLQTQQIKRKSSESRQSESRETSKR